VWAGVAEHPLGPWRNALGEGRQLVPYDFKPGFHMIDAEYFIDDDGVAYLYWGSGHGWKNGRCWLVKLKPDLTTFDGEVQDVTPANYFEGPVVVKRHGLYFLTYSAGKTIAEDYRVHYAVTISPLGPRRGIRQPGARDRQERQRRQPRRVGRCAKPCGRSGLVDWFLKGKRRSAALDFGESTLAEGFVSERSRPKFRGLEVLERPLMDDRDDRFVVGWTCSYVGDDKASGVEGIAPRA
jgi:hypothetical protein